MRQFLTAFSLEFKKILASKGFWIFAIVILVLCLIVTATFRSIGEMLEGMDDSVLTGNDMSAGELAEAYRLQLESYTQSVENGDIERKLSDTTETNLKNLIAICEYCDEHGINVNEISSLGSIVSLNMGSGDYVVTMMQIVFAFVTIMAIVLAAKVFAGEIEDGTMRMQLTRPIKRSALLTAKHTAVFSASMVLGIAMTVLFMVIGAIFFKGNSHDVILVDAYQNVALINTYTQILLLLAFSAVTVAVSVQLTLFVGTFMTKTGALAVPLVWYLFANTVAMFLYDTGIPFVGLFTNLNWATGLTPAGAPVRGMSIYTMMAVTAVWFAVMTTVNYTAFEKRDLK